MINRGKQFESIIREQFEQVDDTVVIRLYDVTTGYKNQNNPCDIIVFNRATLNLFELKAIHGNTLNFKSHIRENQWNKLLVEHKKHAVNAGVICWFIDLDKTYFIDIAYLQMLKESGYKSFNAKDFDVSWLNESIFEICGKKKKIFFEYNELDSFLENISYY